MPNFMKKYGIHFLLFFIVLLFIFLRIPNLDSIFFGDETAWPYLIKYQLENGLDFSKQYQFAPATSLGTFDYWIDLPLTGLMLIGWAKLFGTSIVALRSISVVFSLLNLILLFLIAKKLFNTKIAVISSFLFAVSYWNLFSSYMIDRDSSVVTLVISAAVYAYLLNKDKILNKINKNSISPLLMISSFAAIAMFVKITAVLALFVVSLFILVDMQIVQNIWKRKKVDFLAIKSFVIKMFFLYVVFVTAYFAFTILLRTFSHDFAAALFEEFMPADVISISGMAAGIARAISYIVLFGSPLLIGLAFLSCFSFSKKKLYILEWMIVPFCAYSVAISAGAVDRYLTVLVPPLALLAASFIGELKFTKKETVISSIFALFFFIVLFFMNKMPVVYATHDMMRYIKNALLLKWDFIFQFYGAGGPNFMMSFIPIGITLLLTMASLVVYVLFKNRLPKFAKLVLIIFISVSFAFQALVIYEFEERTYPDVDKVAYKMIEIYNNEIPSSEKGFVYTTAIYSGMPLQLKDVDFSDIIVFTSCKKDETCWSELYERQKSRKGVGFYIEYPLIPSTETAKNFFESKCVLYRNITDKGTVFGKIYSC